MGVFLSLTLESEMQIPLFNIDKLCPKWLAQNSAKNKESIVLLNTLDRGINFILMDMFNHLENDVAIATIPSWLSPYLNISYPPSSAQPDKEYTSKLAYYQPVIETYLAKELLI